MIEDISIEKLVEYGFSKSDIERFETWGENYESFFSNRPKGNYFASNKEKKIYSGRDASRKYYFRNENQISFPRNEMELIPEYFTLKLDQYLKARKHIAGDLFNELKFKNRFKEEEIERTNQEINQAVNEIKNKTVSVLIKIAADHKTKMECYLDWLNEFEFQTIAEQGLKNSAIFFDVQIDEMLYRTQYAFNIDTMDFYEQSLKRANDKLSLTTTIHELPEIYSIIEKWNRILIERQKHSPTKELAKKEFQTELLTKIDYNDNLPSSAEVNNDKYYNRYRKFSYLHRCKGQPVTMQGLGHLILRQQCRLIDGVNVVTNIVTHPDLAGILETLAEGSAMAEYLYSENNNLIADIPIENHSNNLVKSFDEIFAKDDWNKYVSALSTTTPPIISEEWAFIGNRKKHIGVVCSWFSHLQSNGIIKQNISRSKLAYVLNSQLKNFNMGTDGKTFDNFSSEYDKKFKHQLLSISKM
jgi:hypothetical protein